MTDRLQARLLIGAAAFLFLYSLILSLSPAVRERSWTVDYRFSHWLGFIVWAALFAFTQRETARRLPDRDPYLVPLAALLSGWGMLTIWRLDPAFGLRQAAWLIVSTAVLHAILRLPPELRFLHRYKYLLLTSGLLLTSLTLLFGTNPAGYGPRLWLGCCGFYLQPSEPLKLLLVAYLAAYLATRLPIRLQVFPLLFPTLIVTILALLILLVQRDLGTASIFILLYTSVLFIATGRRRALIATAGGLALAGLLGYFLIGIVHSRIDDWLNPWNDPSGRSYQVIQSLLAVGNGGAFGRGPGLGSPGLVPVAISDFIYTAIAEETGLFGTMGLLTAICLLLARSLRAALRAPDRFRRLLAAGLTAYLGVQSLLIIGGNLRLLPLTGVTLPFVSYGGSSLLTSFIAVGLLLVIGGQPDQEPAPLDTPQPYFLLAGLLGAGVLAISVANAWWAIVRGPDMLGRTDNPRRALADRYVLRGSLLDRNNLPIDVTGGQSGEYQRHYLYPALAPISGYTNPRYGQAGLEASLDGFLRGLQGNPTSLIWWDHLLYGTPPPGLDVRLSLDLHLQERADDLLGQHAGAVVLINSQSGEILAIASHPTYDPNHLDSEGAQLAHDPATPLVDRAAQGRYEAGTVIRPFINLLGPSKPSDEQVRVLFRDLGFYSSPEARLPSAIASPDGELENLRLSPLQMAVAAACLSHDGIRPAARIALAVKTPMQGWVVLPALGRSEQVFAPDLILAAMDQLAVPGRPYWQWTSTGRADEKPVTWFVAGTLPNWQGTPLTIVVVVEENQSSAARLIGQGLLQEATQP
jgi:cell division protein FtsW (lipid II flippase)